ncbi:MAG TPA: thiamine-phosphate kinase [Rhizomicrobium sp.]|nr:thiamine-phosphate kinase [Rhizomicrobium sp.]
MTLPSEFELIEKLFAPLATSPGAFGLKDDVAAIAPRAGCELIVTTDAIVAGIDFFPGDPAEGVARKALRVNLSDLAAKGAEPFGYLLTLLIPGETSPSWLAEFAGGLRQDQERFAISLLGGDMSSTPGPLSVSVTALGHVPAGRLVRRNGARAGDGVFVTGTIGDSGGGLDLLRHPSPGVAADVRAALTARYRLPEPRVGFAQSVRGASASIDVSDGLLADLGHIARASGVRIVVEAARVPRSDALKALWGESQDAWVRAATAGDDYEIAFTASSPIAGGDIPVARIGRVEQGSGVVLLGPQGREIEVPRAGYRHF